jgi:hypothetical protein
MQHCRNDEDDLVSWVWTAGGHPLLIVYPACRSSKEVCLTALSLLQHRTR